MVRLRLGLIAVGLAMACAWPPADAPAQDPAPAPAPIDATADVSIDPVQPSPAPAGAKGATKAAARPAAGVGRQSVKALLTTANPMLWLLGLCSIVTVGYTMERLVALRRGRVIPRDFVNRFLERLSGGKLDRERAAELCRSNDSAMARVFGHVVRYWGQPSALIRQAVDHDAAREVVDLKRNIRVLNGTATLAPLLGLLGTVIGMIQSFDAIGGRSVGAKGEALAQGISLALVSTAIGLGIAVVSVSAYYFLLNRVDVLVRDLDDNARTAIDLVCAESLRPAVDRRIDHARAESRLH